MINILPLKILVKMRISLDLMMTILLRRKCLMFISTVIIVMTLSILFIRYKSTRTGLLNVSKVSKNPMPLLTSTNSLKVLSTALIQNRIYPRPTNLKNIAYDITNIPYNNISCPLFITMADIFYLPAVCNFHLQLQNYGLRNNLIVMCLDHACVKSCQSKNILSWDGSVNRSVARVKVGYHYFSMKTVV